eukprot:GHVS01075590.1.p1 GENE.GHVS01075590.1~~GHVS01075590.1.p1  ORF type:complete len:127 (+),score=9.66 GHVS01075590.1:122-502(+)
MVSGKSWWDGKCYHDCVAPKELVEAGGGVSVDWEYANPPQLTSATSRCFQNVDDAMDACCSELVLNATAGPGRVRAAEVAYYSETAEGIISCDKSQLVTASERELHFHVLLCLCLCYLYYCCMCHL